ncbi:hypothetical protein DICPUDRAFT_151843 [Dictyostelium purpureum]|uniref:DUF962 domain-containing protein n=1 Tax=Dictyostelium purpureum TaxID=5786 RepID=F0ZJW5_DICPU|nr:uncharacterized protein DICPUDRAFT_151843 [Dictyostelium purpureum]EGC35753.1 hypothetical protein DICPUDRAFT_151843 [Dictyostelium purpureum]|eukprot:XP_003287705.1 hypothetical protein DICPUDRAFT_151843 [Dictyostelium purpureum]
MTSNESREIVVYRTFKDFYPFYLVQHSNRINRRLHFVGTSLALLTLGYSLYARNPNFILLALVLGYGFAWVGHFFFEKNRPATFKYPVFSLRGDMVMWKSMITGKLKI